MKPQLAEDADLSKLRMPCIVQPKIDGVRALNLTGQLTGRSLDAFKGFGITEFFSKPEYLGFDGEMILGHVPNCTERLCSATTGAMGRFKDVTEMADLSWHVFDFVTPETVDLPYRERYSILKELVAQRRPARVELVSSYPAYSLEELQKRIASFYEQGYEGTILRNPDAPYKPGRATQKGQELWRIKPWADAEIFVTGITEGSRNENTAKTNSLGRTERSSAQAGLVPNGQLGSIQGTLLADFYDPISGKRLFEAGLPVTVGSGEMTIREATRYFENQNEIVGHVIKFRFMTYGIKDLPRFPSYVCHRLAEDIS